ncbi:MAG TPA: ABC transporter substrate-binding protein [Methanomassiliicoccales archaeon]|jgi:peptide/nickel transport system substrate-binding protein
MDRPLPEDKVSKRGSRKKLYAIIVVAVLVVAGILAALALSSGSAKAPTVAIGANTGSVALGGAVTYNANGSSSSDGSINNYTWYFGDGAVAYTTAPTVTHTYQLPGNYLAVLVAKTDKGASAGTWASPASVKVTLQQPATGGNTTAPSPLIAVSSDVIASGGKEITVDGNGSAAWDMSYSATGWNYTTDPPHRGVWSSGLSQDAIKTLTWTFSDRSPSKSGNVSVAGTFNKTFSGAGTVQYITLKVTSIHDIEQSAVKTIIVQAANSGTGSKVKNPDTFVMATAGDPESFDPAYDYETAGGEVIQNVYETLVWFNGSSPNDLVPMLAKEVPTYANGLISADGKNYTYNIRPNVMFHDGTIMDANDVKYSISRVLLSNNYYSAAWMLGNNLLPLYQQSHYATSPQDISNDGVVITQAMLDNTMTVSNNSMTITFHLVAPYPAFNKVMAFTVASVVSDSFVQAHGGSPTLGRNNYMDDHEAGTGAFKLGSWEKGQSVNLERFDNYWRTPAKLQFVHIVKFDIFATRLMMLQTGDADCIYVPRDSQLAVKGNPDYRIGSGNLTFNMDFLGLNEKINPSNTVPYGNVPTDFFKDVNIRRAFANVFNYTSYIDNVMKGTGFTPNGPIPKGMQEYDASIPVYSFDLNKAATFLKAAINPATGHSWADDGFDLKLYFNQGNDDREKACLNMKAGLEALTSQHLVNGAITVEVQGLDWSTAYLPAQRAGQLATFFLGWAPDYSDADDYVLPFLHSTLGTYPTTIGLANTTLDAMIIQAGSETNTTLRAELYHNISMSAYDNAYYIWTSQAYNFHVERSWVHGYYFNALFSQLYYYPMYKA